MRIARCFVAVLIVLLLVACEKGNLPGIATTMPVYPGAVVGETAKGKIKAVPSGDVYAVRSVMIQTDEAAPAVLEYYKGVLLSTAVTDFGGYYTVTFVPEGWKEGDRIEILIDKEFVQDTIDGELPAEPSPGYEIRQVRKKWGILP